MHMLSAKAPIFSEIRKSDDAVPEGYREEL
jgi:hypothetical protein